MLPLRGRKERSPEFRDEPVLFRSQEVNLLREAVPRIAAARLKRAAQPADFSASRRSLPVLESAYQAEGKSDDNGSEPPGGEVRIRKAGNAALSGWVAHCLPSFPPHPLDSPSAPRCLGSSSMGQPE